ncbi:hypothetical protein FW800_23215 [Pseudomonas sp. 910_23]|uniref:Uncharacterized protein n=1 Tax=Pseudomonas synxantha TaxID=47883 RepID=A0A5D3GHH6_9PSED|nr:hypothetical protein [Pseudomonas sp. W2Aug9]MCK3833104.1 hypothetical protein [Pseudomonas fluorescens]MCK3840118.1 hypothetical protein [Pseudomonas sp. NCIMB 10586]MCK3844593.1 hypothetical protein [Pseudomonas sp. W15Feb34]MCK3853461.1 hypothetical protein [Pseudomonas sp. W2Jun17]MCK3865869.1 hypothetical protein [Pseudomonas sp. B329]OPB07333.1 hypothetical protein BFW89_08250 [Pseudomonas synxantha]
MYLVPCGSWLACDAGTSVHQTHRVDAIAGKPAPTGASIAQLSMKTRHSNVAYRTVRPATVRLSA